MICKHKNNKIKQISILLGNFILATNCLNAVTIEKQVRRNQLFLELNAHNSWIIYLVGLFNKYQWQQ